MGSREDCVEKGEENFWGSSGSLGGEEAQAQSEVAKFCGCGEEETGEDASSPVVALIAVGAAAEVTGGDI